MNKKQPKQHTEPTEESPYFKYFETLFKTFNINNNNKNVNKEGQIQLDYSKKSEEFNAYVSDFLNSKIQKKN